MANLNERKITLSNIKNNIFNFLSMKQLIISITISNKDTCNLCLAQKKWQVDFEGMIMHNNYVVDRMERKAYR